VLYELAMGERPFGGDSPAMLMTAILRDEPRPIGDRRPDLPDAFGRLVARCLEKRPNDRIQTARDVYNQLRALQREAAATIETVPSPGAGVGRRDPGSGAGRSDLWMAVLPFTSRGDDESAALAAGLTEEIAAGLTRFQYLKVAASRDRARYLLEGSVRRLGSTIRIAVELKDLQAGVQLWGEKYDRGMGADLFAVQDDIAARVVARVGDGNGILVQTMAAALLDRPLDGLTAFELLLRLMTWMNHPREDEHGRLRRGCEARLAADSRDATAWSVVALLYLTEHIYRFNVLPDSLGRAMQAAQRAIEIDPACQGGWYVIAFVHFFRRDRDGFRAAADRTISLNPLNTNWVAFIAHMIAYSGDWERGVALQERIIDLTPQHPGTFYFMPFHDLYRRGEYERAAQMLKRANMPNDPWLLLNTVPIAVQLGRWAEVRAALDTMRRLGFPHLDPQVARVEWSKFVWDTELVDRMMRNFERALEDTPSAEAAVATTAVRPPSASPESSSSIAVLPFVNLSADPENEYFGDGLAEEVLNALNGVPGLTVIARTSAFAFKGKTDDVRRIGETLGVTTVLEGSVRRSGDRVRVTAQLVDIRDGSHRWSQRYDRQMTDIFAVQDDIAREIVTTLRGSLTGTRGTIRAQNVEAYDAYLKGRYEMASLTAEGLERARAYFERAIAIEPDYAPPHADLAGCSVMGSEFSLVSWMEAMPRARAQAERALALDPTSPDAHHWLARVAAQFDFDWPRALRHYDQAIASGRITPETHRAMALWVLTPLGRVDEVIAIANQAMSADPVSPNAPLLLASLYRLSGEPQKALELVERIDSGLADTQRGNALAALGRDDEAIAALERALTRSPIGHFAVAGLAMVYRRRGDMARAEEALARLDGPRWAPTRDAGRALYHVAFDEFVEAAACMHRLIAARSPWSGTTAAVARGRPEFRNGDLGRGVLRALRIPHEYW